MIIKITQLPWYNLSLSPQTSIKSWGRLSKVVVVRLSGIRCSKMIENRYQPLKSTTELNKGETLPINNRLVVEDFIKFIGIGFLK